MDESNSVDGYVDQSKTSRSLLSLMTKVRATQTLGSVLCDKKNHARAYALYEKTINEMLGDNVREHFKFDQIVALQTALTEAKQEKAVEDQAWCLRKTMDTVYDACVELYNPVVSQNPPSLHKHIKETITSASTMIEAGDFSKGLDQYLVLLKRIKLNLKFKECLNPAGLKLLEDSLEIAEKSDNTEAAVAKVRENLDRIYNQIRLPDVYGNSTPQTAMNMKASVKKQGLLMIDFRQKDGSLFPYHLQSVDDKVMNGKSQSYIELLQDEQYLEFHGTVSKVNKGGFASFRIIPSCREEMKKVLTGVEGITLELQNLKQTNKRYKFQLANESHLKSFNWQSEFIIEPNGGFQKIYLDIQSFWPTMFGHILSSPGKVDISKVDCLGIILSHVSVDGKSNPDFVEGEFGLAIRSISVVKQEET